MWRNWVYAVRRGLLPLLFTILITTLFLIIPQAREALFGTVGPEYSSKPLDIASVGRRPFQMMRSQFGWLVVGTIWMALTVWYTARQLVSIDWSAHLPHSAQTVINASGMRRPITHFPRLLGAITAALLVFAVFNAYNPPSWTHSLSAVLIAFLPLLMALTWQISRWKSVVKILATIAVVAVNAGVVLWKLSEFPAPISLIQWFSMFALSCVPAALYCFTVYRRVALRKIRTKATIRDAGTEVLSPSIWFPLCIGAVGLVLLFLLARAQSDQVRTIGSCAILLAFLGSALCILTAFNLALRRWATDKPGIIFVIILVIVFSVAALQSRVDEPIGAEILAPPEHETLHPQLTQAATAKPDIIVNAYGGGLRAALYTGQVLSSLDDSTCGAFGARLQSLSGVSGGSLGIAVYLTMRQELVANGGWGPACHPAIGNPPTLRKLVEDALKVDHLSPVIAKWLTSDLLAMGVPQRGQALLDSWQQAVVYALSGIEVKPGTVSRVGLARPLRELSGGLATPPRVYFNTTDARNGFRIWLSNSGQWSDGKVPAALIPDLQVGQAVLHSARFPLVSPAGKLALDKPRTVIDGGYADNSGVGTLVPGTKQQHPAAWLNINGNPPEKCGDEVPKADTTWTPVGGLLALRTSQARLAEMALRDACPVADSPGTTPSPTCPREGVLQMNLDQAFTPTMPEVDQRCKFVHGLRSAPLGWYMSPATMGDQNMTVTAAIQTACQVLGKLCNPD